MNVRKVEHALSKNRSARTVPDLDSQRALSHDRRGFLLKQPSAGALSGMFGRDTVVEALGASRSRHYHEWPRFDGSGARDVPRSGGRRPAKGYPVCPARWLGETGEALRCLPEELWRLIAEMYATE